MCFGVFEDRPHLVIILYKNCGGVFYGGSTSQGTISTAHNKKELE